MKTISILAALFATTLTAAPAFAQVATPQRTVAVSFADLNLRSEDGRAALDSRIRSAIREVCGNPSPADLRGQNRAADCRAELSARVSLQRDVALAAAQKGGNSIAIRR